MHLTDRTLFFLGCIQATAVLSMISFVIVLFVTIYGLRVYPDPESPANRVGRAPYIALSFVLCTAALVWAGANNWLAYNILINLADTNDNYSGIEEVYNTAVPVVQAASFNAVIVLIGDGLIIYRCYYVWIERKWVVILPCVTYLANLAMIIRYLNPKTDIHEGTNQVFLAVSTFLKVSINIYTTFLMSYRLLRHYRQNRATLPYSSQKDYLNIISILLESALPVTLAGIMHAVTVIIPSTSDLAYKVYWIVGIVYWISCQLSPQWIMFRVATGKSWVSDATLVSKPLCFTQGLGETGHISTTDQAGSIPEQTQAVNEDYSVHHV